MYPFLNSLEQLIETLYSLPGVSKKMASRMACFLLEQNENFLNDFCLQIKSTKAKINYCAQCNNYAEQNTLCNLCQDQQRQHNKICIVTNYLDLVNIENSLSWNGIYYVLGKELSAHKKSSPSELNVQKLLWLIDHNISEVVIATDFTANGKLTATTLYQIIREHNQHVKIFRLGLGMPTNSSIDYADNATLNSAFANKREYQK